MEKTSYKRISFEERVIIEDRLSHNCSLKSIAKELNRSTSTITREVTTYCTSRKADPNCMNYSSCSRKNLCPDCKSYYRSECKKCRQCRRVCPDYFPYKCDIKEKPPYVCNSCQRRRTCQLGVVIYRARTADGEAVNHRRDSRTGFNITQEDFEKIDRTISPLIQRGLSPYHILQECGDDLNISESTLRRLINSTQISTRNIDLRRATKLKPRKKHSTPEIQTISAAKEGHTWQDFLEYKEKHSDLHYVELDCVEGTKSDNAVLMTLHFKWLYLQIALILDEHTEKCVIDALDRIESALGKELFREMLPAIVTDNGHEFWNREGMERSIYGGKRTIVFYCEPRRSDEKGSCERNHELIRYIIPKGTSLEPYNQMDITLMMNHINSYRRKAIGGKSPYELARFMGVPDDFFILLGLEEIPGTEINLTRKLFQYKWSKNSGSQS